MIDFNNSDFHGMEIRYYPLLSLPNLTMITGDILVEAGVTVKYDVGNKSHNWCKQ